LVLLARRGPADEAAPFDKFAALLVAVGILNLGMSRGILEGRYLAPLPVVLGVLFLSTLVLERGEDRWALASLVTSLVLAVLFRPESPVVGLVVAGVLLVRWRRRKGPTRVVLAGTAAVLGVIAVAGVTNLLLATERDVLVFGADTAQHPSGAGLVGMVARRVVTGWLPSFLVQGLWTGGLLFLSVPVAVRALRGRADLPTWIALVWLYLELTILSVHDAGPAIQWQKYGLVLIGPAWFLAVRHLLRDRGTRRHAWSVRAVVILVAMTFAGSLVLAGIDRQTNRKNRDWLFNGAEALVAEVCPPGSEDDQRPVLTIVLEGSFTEREGAEYHHREVDFLPVLLDVRGCGGPWEYLAGPADASSWESGEPCRVFPSLCAEETPDDVLIVADGCPSWGPHLATLFDGVGEGGWRIRYRDDMVLYLRRPDPSGPATQIAP